MGHHPPLHEPPQPRPGPHPAPRTRTPPANRGGHIPNPNQPEQNPTTEATRNPLIYHIPGRDLFT